ncbi:CCC motif membrane protein [Winogradskyella sp. ECml5-4]|uniref:CCC motif membrane protein n=1 Tax=Winogradskyella sp. ECml5-4 TaxID=3110975 RepID=UPI002FEEDC34
MNQNKLSADPLALILGVLALVIGIASCCCYGITAIVPLIMAIIGLVVANKSLKEFGENPEAFSPQSRSNVNTAKIINIIAIVINGLIVLMAAAVLIFYGTMLSSGMLDGFNDFENDDYYYDSEMESDSLNTWEDDTYEDDTYIIEEDSTEVDTSEKEFF